MQPNEAPPALLKVMNTIQSIRSRMASFLGQTHDGARDMYQQFGYSKDPRIDEIFGIYKRNGLANRIVRAYPRATWKDVPTITDESEGEEGAFNKAVDLLFKELKLYREIERADRLATIGQYGVLVLGFEGNGKLDTPVAKNAKLIYTRAYAQAQPITINKFDLDTKSARYGLPEIYTINPTPQTGPANQQVQSGVALRVHWSRIIHIAEDLDEDRSFATPRLIPLLNWLSDLEKLLGSGAETFWLNARQALAITADKDAGFTADDITAMKDQADEYQHQLRRVLAIQGVTVTNLPAAFTDPGPLIDKLLDCISGASGIPKRILIGAERGELGGDNDEANWSSRIKERRENFATPSILQPLITRLIETGNVPQPQGEWFVTWPEGSDPQREAELGAKRSAMLSQYLSAPGAELVVPLEEFRETFLGLDPVSEYDIAGEEEMINPPPAAAEPGAVDPLTGEPLEAAPGEDVDEGVPEEEEAVDPRKKTADRAEEIRKRLPFKGGPKAFAAPRSLYVCRKVVNAKDIIKWAKSQGIEKSLPAEELHVTVAYSRKPVDWMKMSAPYNFNPDNPNLTVTKGGPRLMDLYGPKKDTLVLLFNCSELSWRHQEVLGAGGSWDWNDYQPHVTITRDMGDLDLVEIEPYQGEIILGPEEFHEVKENWQDGVKEVKVKKEAHNDSVPFPRSSTSRKSSKRPS